MIFKKQWLQQDSLGSREWPMEGWYLFGFIPLFVRDLNARGRFGKNGRASFSTPPAPAAAPA